MIAVMALAVCQLGLQGSNAQDKSKDKGPPQTQKSAFSPGPGELKAPAELTMKCGTPGAVIRFTLDGSTPTADTGTIYSEPIKLDKTTTITAIALAKDFTPSQVSVATYLFSPKTGLSTFHIGNSLTNTTGKFSEFVRTAGIIHKYDSFTAGGHLTWQLWDNQLPKRQKEWDTKLAAYKKIDHFTVQPRDFTNNTVDHEADYCIRFFETIHKHSPEMQPWFYAEWVEKNRPRPTDQGKMQSFQMKKIYPAQTWEESMAAMLLYNEDLRTKVMETYNKEGRFPPRVLPSCLAMGWIKNMIDRDKLPGAAKDTFYPLLFSDAVHPNVKGGYLVDLTWYAAFYRESPEGKVLPAGTGLTLEQARVMQKLAWDVVKNYPGCGLYEVGEEAVATPELGAEEAASGKTRPVTLTSKTPGAWFRYTLDGTTPTRTRGYVYCGVVNVPADATLKAIAYKSGMKDSEAVELKLGPEKGK
jgi:hypothetical protein